MGQTLTDLYDARVAAGDLRADAGQRAVLPRLQALRERLEAGPPPRPLLRRLFAAPDPAPVGIYFWGGVGTGKSMLMDLFFDTVDIAAKRRVHFHAFMQEVHAALDAARQAGHADALRPVADEMGAGLRLLAFDEMQITDITDAMIVGRLFTLLFEVGVTVVSTSNRPPDDLYKDGLNRALFVPFIALLKTRMDVVELESGTDYRRHRLTGAQVYFCPLDARARARLDAIWRDLTGGQAQELRLRVKGRDVVLPGFHNGVARASFWDLCGRPLGPADYLAVAGAVRVLILEEIPRLSRGTYNEARRFVTLIDALYEGRVRLIASAADVPERLYIEGEGTFEFDRTASRLHEMQSDDWAARADAAGSAD